jgi:hypothetical protein
MTVKGHSVNTLNEDVDLKATLGVGLVGRHDEGLGYWRKLAFSPTLLFRSSIAGVLDRFIVESGATAKPGVQGAAGSWLAK